MQETQPDKMNKIRFLKLLDSYFGKLACTLLTQHIKERSLPFPSARVLFIRPGGIGDAVYLLPILSLLKSKYPDASIDILSEKRNAAVFSFATEVESLFRYDVPQELITCLRKHYDIIIDSEQWHRLSAVVASLIKAEFRIGFGTNERSRLFNHAVSYSHDDHELISFSRLLKPLIDVFPLPKLGESFLHLPGALIENVKNKFTLLEKSLVAIAPGASVAERRWGGNRFALVAEELASHGYNIVIVGAAADSQDAAVIKNSVPRAVDLTGKTSLQEAAAVLSLSRLLICADSGLLHIAVALGIPTVSLFGPGRRKKWAPLSERHRVIDKQLSCSPCTTYGSTPPCSQQIACMQQIIPQEVISAACEILE